MDVRISLLGGFSVTVDGIAVPDDAWTRRQAAGLVKVLALARGRRMHREQLIDALWPETPVDVAGPRLHKAAHYARKALPGDPRAVVLRSDLVTLFPDADVSVDVVEFRERGEAAVAGGSAEGAASALELYAGPLLPEDVYDAWTVQPRESLSVLRGDLLRLAGRWEEILRENPVDEQAHLAIVRGYADRGDTRAALRQFERMDQALRRELGTAPSQDAEALRRQLVQKQNGAGRPSSAAAPAAGNRLVGRRHVGDAIRERLEQADAGGGSTVLLTGPPGVGKSAVLDLTVALAKARGWRIGRGTASAVEGPWPYAPVLEALSGLCRQHPTLLDGLADNYREELDRALAGGEVVWSGETAHQKLFVAAAELMRLAAAGHGLLLVVDDIHEADEASLRLLHYLARCAVSEPALIALAHRSTIGEKLDEIQASLIARGIGSSIELAPLDAKSTRRLLAHRFPSLDDATAERIWQVSGGLPFAVLELAASADGGGTDESVGTTLPRAAQQTFQRVAMLGTSFTTDELLAVAGVEEEAAYRHLDMALAALVVEPADTGYRFRHALLREGLLSAMPPHQRALARRQVAELLAEMGAPPARVAHQYLEAGRPQDAIPYVVPAVESAGALGAYRDALALVDAVLAHAGGEELGHLLARRGDLLMALGDPESVVSYRQAVPLTSGTQHRLVRARLARASCFLGDFETAQTALDGLEPQGDDADGPILLARGNLSYFTGDIDAAWEAAAAARRLLLTPDDPWHYVDLVALQGLIAHQRGEWFERFRLELRRTDGKPGLATALFDAHLCVAEYLLYGPVPYAEVIELAEGLRRRAQHFGALRGVAFTTALIGEAALLMGDLDRAERELSEAVDLHRDADASAGESHSLQRLAELRLAQGNHVEAQRLLQRSLPLARWSVMSMHLLQRIYGTMIAAAPDPWAARAVVEKAEDTMGETDSCPFCDVMLAVPASIACADVDDVDDARRYLEVAEVSAARWEGSAWHAAVLEARAHLARANREREEFEQLIEEATRLFESAGQPIDAARCRRARESWASTALQGA